MMFPVIPVLATGGVAVAGAILAWYTKLTKLERVAANGKVYVWIKEGMDERNGEESTCIVCSNKNTTSGFTH